MKPITSILQLISHLKECTDNELKECYKLINIPLQEFEPYTFWDDKKHTRNCIIRTQNFELLLLCWNSEQESAIHYHNNQECWLYNVSGSFKEERYVLNNGIPEKKDSFDLATEQYSYMNDDMGLHKMIASHPNNSISLHLYSKPIDECIHFNEQTQQMETTKLNYHSLEGRITKSI